MSLRNGCHDVVDIGDRGYRRRVQMMRNIVRQREEDRLRRQQKPPTPPTPPTPPPVVRNIVRQREEDRLRRQQKPPTPPTPTIEEQPWTTEAWIENLWQNLVAGAPSARVQEQSAFTLPDLIKTLRGQTPNKRKLRTELQFPDPDGPIGAFGDNYDYVVKLFSIVTDEHRDGRPKKAFNLANLKVYLLKPNNPLKRVMLTTQTPVLRSAAGRLAAVLAAGQERECVKK